MSTPDSAAEILIVDDEVQIRRLLRLTLESARYRVREAETAAQGLQEIAFRRPDAVVLDVGLPDFSGVEALRRLREWSQVPVLMLSVLGQEDQKIAALDSGADDYLTKPFGGGELLARVRVLLRRTPSEDGITVVGFGGIEVDLAGRRVTRAGRAVELSPKEYAFLRLLVLHRGKVLTHRQVLREIWGPKAEEQTHYLRVYMDRLRQKLEDEPGQPAFLKTVLGVGYRLETEL